MSSAGLRVILDAYQQANRRGTQIRLAAAQTGVYKVLETAGFTKIIGSFASVEEALSAAEE